MATNVTVKTLLSNLRQQQNKGSEVATALGISLIGAATVDAYCNATGNSSFSGWILSSLTGRPFGIAALIMQVLAICLGLVAMVRSRWKSAHAVRFIEVMKDGLVARQDGRPSSVAFKVATGLFSALWLLSVYSVYQPSHDLFLRGMAPLVAVLLGTVLAFDLSSMVFTARDLWVQAGMVAVIATIGSGQGYGEPGHMSDIVDLRYWEFSLFTLVVLGSAYAFIGRRTANNTMLIELSSGNVTEPVTSLPFHAEGDGRLIFGMFSVESVKLAVLYGSPGSKELEFINVDDPQICLPLQNHSLTVWNLSLLESRLPKAKSLQNRTGHFKATGNITQMATAATFRNRQGVFFDSLVVKFASDIFFNNQHLSDLFNDLAQTVLDEAVEEFAQEINRLDLEVQALLTEIQLQPQQAFELTPPKDITLRDLTAIRQALTYRFAMEHNVRVKEVRQCHNVAVWKAGVATKDVSDKWNEKLRARFDARATGTKWKSASSSGSLEHQTTSLMDALGLSFRLSEFAETTLTATVRTSIDALGLQITNQLSEAGKAYKEAVAVNDANILDVIKTIISGPPVTPEMLERLLRQASGLSLDDGKVESTGNGSTVAKRLN